MSSPYAAILRDAAKTPLLRMRTGVYPVIARSEATKIPWGVDSDQV